MSKQYLVAAKAVKEVNHGRSLKNYCNSVKMSGTEYALCCETLKYYEVIDRILKCCHIVVDDLEVDKYLFIVMVYELLFGKKKINGGGFVKRKVLEYIEQLRSSLHSEMADISANVTTDLISEQMKLSSNLPKYARVNEIKLSLCEGLAALKKLYPEATFDDLIPSLVVLPPHSSAISKHPLVLSGEVILQDKASCLPSQVH